MPNDYGVYREDQAGIPEWVTNLSPLTVGSADNAIKWNEQDAISTATYLNSIGDGNTYFIGRVPKPHA